MPCRSVSTPCFSLIYANILLCLHVHCSFFYNQASIFLPPALFFAFLLRKGYLVHKPYRQKPPDSLKNVSKPPRVLIPSHKSGLFLKAHLPFCYSLPQAKSPKPQPRTCDDAAKAWISPPSVSPPHVGPQSIHIFSQEGVFACFPFGVDGPWSASVNNKHLRLPTK